MPRALNIDDEIAATEAVIKEGNGDRRDRQYTARPTAATALPFLRDCKARGQPPAIRLAELMDEYYAKATANSLFDLFPAQNRELLRLMANLRGQSMEEVLAGLVQKHLVAELTEASMANRSPISIGQS